MKRKIVVCMGSSCFARGNEENLKIIESFLAANHLDAEVVLAGTRCTGECSKGPNIVVDGAVFNRMTKEALIDLLNETFLSGDKKTGDGK